MNKEVMVKFHNIQSEIVKVQKKILNLKNEEKEHEENVQALKKELVLSVDVKNLVGEHERLKKDIREKEEELLKLLSKVKDAVDIGCLVEEKGRLKNEIDKLNEQLNSSIEEMDLMLKEVNKLLDSNEKPSAVDEVISIPPIEAAPVIGSGNPNCSSAPIKAAPLTAVQSSTIIAKDLSDNKIDDNSVVNPFSFSLPPFDESKSSGGGSIMGGGGGMRKADDFPLEEESFKSLVSTICQKHFAGTYMRHAYYDSTSEAIANEVFSLIQRSWTKK